MESADVCILSKSSSSLFSTTFLAENLIKEAFSHAGQQCQRLQGAYVEEDFFEEISAAIRERFVHMINTGEINIYTTEYQRSLPIASYASYATELISNNESFPLVLVNPFVKDFIHSASFLPTLWLLPFTNINDLKQKLEERTFYNGINIWTADPKFAEYLTINTPDSRITINKSHTEIGVFEEWGGVFPSGVGGACSWLERFSNHYQKNSTNI